MKVKRGKESSKRKIKVKKETFFDKIRKKGLSTTVALVLIVLVSVVMVSVLWFGVSSFLTIDINTFDARLSVETSQDYTFYDPTDQSVTVQLSAKGKDKIDYAQIIIKLSDGKELISVHDAPAPNNVKRYYFDLASYFNEGLYPVSVSVAPIFSMNGKYVLGKRIADVKLPKREAMMLEPNSYYNQEKRNPTSDYSTGGYLGKYSSGGTNNGGITGNVIINVTDCRELDESGVEYRLVNDVSSSGTCFTITSDSINLDCNGFKINYGKTLQGYGVYSTKFNTNIRNCIINEGSLVNINKHGIYLDGADNCIIENNNIITNSHSSCGIFLNPNSDNNILYKNDIITLGNEGHGISLSSSSNSNISYNTISTSGTSDMDDGAYGIRLSYGPESIISNNNIITSKNDGDGIYMSSSSNSNIYSNNIALSGNYGDGIYMSSSSNSNIYSNNITTSGALSKGFDLGYSNNCTVRNNVIVTFEQESFGFFLHSSNLNSIYNNNINTSGIAGLGVYISNSYDNLFKDLNVLTINAVNGYGVLISGGKTNTTIKDSKINALNSEDIFVSNQDLGSFLKLINVSYDNEQVPVGFELYRKWYYKARVVDGAGIPIQGAIVKATNQYNELIWNSVTDSSGLTGVGELIEYFNNGTIKDYNNYTINVSYGGIDIVHEIEISSNVLNDVFTF